jgi:hypothetical protein
VLVAHRKKILSPYQVVHEDLPHPKHYSTFFLIHTAQHYPTIFENIAHLQTYQHMFITRIRLILTEEIPVFSPYSAETDPLFHDNCGLSSREVMQDLLSTRKQLSSAILTFKETDFEREALHSTYGKMNLLLWLNFFLLHEAHHLFTIFKLAVELRKDQR